MFDIDQLFVMTEEEILQDIDYMLTDMWDNGATINEDFDRLNVSEKTKARVKKELYTISNCLSNINKICENISETNKEAE